MRTRGDALAPAHRLDWRAFGLFALVSYVPLLCSAPGQLAADTKAYLYTDPGRLLSRAAWMWDRNFGLGTVTHQTIGYLFPMGPYYWLCQALGLPDWIAQRIWLGTILFAAGTGAFWLLRRLGLGTAGALVAGLVYLASPYTLPYLARTSALLLPWAALPWLTGLVMLTLRPVAPGVGFLARWRAPLLFGLVLTLVGGTNASSVVFVAVGPALWVPFALWGTRETGWRQVRTGVARLAATTVPAQLWWIAGLRIQGRYGLPILQLTESVQTVAQTSTAAEVSRGMGYWYAYGRDGLSPWTTSAAGYTQHLWLIATSFAIPFLAVAAAVFARWTHRAYFVALVVVGLVLGVGTYPYSHPPFFGALVKAATQKSAAGLALRNTPRAVPLLVLGFAALIGMGAEAVAARLRAQRRPALARPLLAGVAVLAVLNLPPLWTAGVISGDLRFPEHLPQYWLDAAAALDAQPHDTRVLELPGSDFAVYRWGETQDPITPGLIDRPWAGRELTAFGTPASVDLIRALDRRLQEGVFDPRSVAPIARLISAGDLLVRSDTQYERYRGPRPRVVWAAMGEAPGLGTPTTFGPPAPNVPDARRPMRDEAELGTPDADADPPPLAVFPVDGAPPIVHAQSAVRPLVVAGDGESLVDAAEAGLLQPGQAILYSASFATDPAGLDDALARGADLLVTDGNRDRAQRWGTVRENNGFTESPGSKPLEDDPKDTRLDVFPGAGTDAYTIAEYHGVAGVAASAYGNTVAYAPDQRPSNAIDGNLRTAWQVGGFSDVIGERLRITLDQPVTTDHIRVTQLHGNRFITRLGVRLDGTKLTTAELGDESFADAGQVIDLGGPRTFREVELSIDGANVSGLPSYNEWSQVGLREVDVAGAAVDEVIRVPQDLLARAGAAAADHNLSVLLTRLRADPAEPWRTDPEARLVRGIDLPAARGFTFRGEARLETRTDGAVVDRLLGRPGRAAGYAEASGGDFLAGDASARPSSAIDGDPTTAWSPGLGPQVGRGFHVALPGQKTVDHLDLALVADGWHSVPTQLSLELDEGGSVVVDVPPVTPGTERGHVVHVPVALPRAVSTAGFLVRVTRTADVTSIEYFSGEPGALPVGIAELGIPGVQAGPLPSQVPSTCRVDLVTIDDRPVPVRLRGSVADALARKPLTLEACDEPTVSLPAGRTTLRSADGIDTGVSVDRVLLQSDVGPAAVTAAAAGATPVLDVHEVDRQGYTVDVHDAKQPFWLVLGQSLSDGWRATVNGSSLGAPTLVDGYANGWLIDPAVTGSDFTVSLRWTPQRVVWVALAISGVALAGLIALLVIGSRSRRPGGFLGTFDAAPAPVLTTDGLHSARAPTLGRSAASRRAAIVLGVGVLAIAVAGVVPGLIVAGATALALFAPWGRAALVLPALLGFPFVASWYVLKQARNRYAMGVEWPSVFRPAHQVVLITVLLLAADVVIGAFGRWRRACPPSGAAGPDLRADDVPQSAGSRP